MADDRSRSVAKQPDRPVMIYDGDCGFCRRWIDRWRRLTRHAIAYAPFQNVNSRYKQIPIEDFKCAVQLVEPDGRVTSGAHAVLRSLALARRCRWAYALYRHLPGFARAAETIYQFVAHHRGDLLALEDRLTGKDKRFRTH